MVIYASRYSMKVWDNHLCAFFEIRKCICDRPTYENCQNRNVVQYEIRLWSIRINCKYFPRDALELVIIFISFSSALRSLSDNCILNYQEAILSIPTVLDISCLHGIPVFHYHVILQKLRKRHSYTVQSLPFIILYRKHYNHSVIPFNFSNVKWPR